MRQARGFTQEIFAENIGIAPRTLCLIETGKNFLTAETLEKILNTLSITPEELFTINHNKPADELKIEMVEMINNLDDPKLLENLYKITKSLVG